MVGSVALFIVWLTCSFSTAGVESIKRPRCCLQHLLAFGFGGILGLLACAGAFILNMAALLPLLVAVGFVFGKAGNISPMRLLKPATYRGNILAIQQPVALYLVVALYLFIYLSLLLKFLAVIPAVGWDALDHWLVMSNYVIENLEVGLRRIGEHRHPATIPIAYALEPWLDSVVSTILGVMPSQNTFHLVGILFFISALCCLLGLSLKSPQNSFAPSAFILLMAFAAPLVENHIVLFGYSDLTLGLLFTFANLCFSEGIRSGQWRFWLIGIVASSLCLAIKYSGFLFLLSTLVAIIAFLSTTQKSNIRFLTVAVALAILTSILVFGFQFEMGGFQIGFDSDRKLLYALKGSLPPYRITTFEGVATHIDVPNFSELISAIFTAHYLNLSYTLVPITFLLFLGWSFLPNSKPSRSTIFLCCSVVSAEAVLLALQFTEYGALYSQKDTTLTRLMLPIHLLIPFFIISALDDALCKNSDKRSGGFSGAKLSEFERLSRI